MKLKSAFEEAYGYFMQNLNVLPLLKYRSNFFGKLKCFINVPRYWLSRFLLDNFILTLTLYVLEIAFALFPKSFLGEIKPFANLASLLNQRLLQYSLICSR